MYKAKCLINNLVVKYFFIYHHQRDMNKEQEYYHFYKVLFIKCSESVTLEL